MNSPEDALELFARVTAAGRFSRAARQLGLTRAAVSLRVAAMEQIVGQTLLARTTDTLLVQRLGNDAQPQQVQPHHHDHGAGLGSELSFHDRGSDAAAYAGADKAVCDPCSPSATGLPAMTEAIIPNARTILLLGPSQ